MIPVENKKVVIVGASSGIGKALSHMFSDKGAIVYLVSRTKEKLEAVQKELKGKSYVFTMDMLNDSSVEETFEKIGHFDYLSISAVADETKLMSPIKSMSNTIAHRGMEKFWGTFNVTRAASKYINQDGAIVVTSSISIYRPSKNGASIMNAASAAVATYSKSLALEIAPVRVNIIAPGVVGTGVWTEQEKESYKEWGKNTLPIKHLGKPEELAYAYYSTLTNPYMTGSIISVDGGLTMI
ncbi:SDR family oxidoreductase [Aquimarina sp. U1-2]|uniref:SDR family oxidoreductase n=1 Tax=Aquimarina sp. U1-2 TaxID=2823141 RepID=UPI001AECFAAF|nr:SDR family oxidoreductase [Aquimarina sp. U1-2]MBP2831065.1 SDR family oxidoreductase [Aquimarina sp. U1-2]